MSSWVKKIIAGFSCVENHNQRTLYIRHTKNSAGQIAFKQKYPLISNIQKLISMAKPFLFKDKFKKKGFAFTRLKCTRNVSIVFKEEHRFVYIVKRLNSQI